MTCRICTEKHRGDEGGGGGLLASMYINYKLCTVDTESFWNIVTTFKVQNRKLNRMLEGRRRAFQNDCTYLMKWDKIFAKNLTK